MAKILIVDDDKDATKLLEKIMLLEGHQPTSVNVSANAPDVARTIHPDLFIVDLMMPEPNGFQLCQILRADANFALTPIIIVTAMDNMDSKTAAMNAGANDYVTKPFHPDDLANRIKALLGKV